MRFVFFLLILLTLSHSGSPAQKKSKERLPQAERITETVYRIGGALVDLEARAVTCKGAINMDRGAIEYLAVAPKGKLHESLLRLDVRPLHLQIALLLLGLEPKNVLKRQGDSTTPQGDLVALRVRWREKSGQEREVAAEELALEMPGEKPIPPGSWVFTGSRILKEGFQADLEGSLVAVWRDPAALVDNRSPGGARNAYVVHTKRVPKQGTPITFVIRAAP